MTFKLYIYGGRTTCVDLISKDRIDELEQAGFDVIRTKERYYVGVLSSEPLEAEEINKLFNQCNQKLEPKLGIIITEYVISEEDIIVC